MMILKFLSLFSVSLMINCISGASIGEQASDTIQMIAVLFRHGHRSPKDLYPKDPHISFEWPGGLGALSQKGALQHFNLGKKLRGRYHQLLPRNGLYTKNDIYVLSSYAERCLMSAQSLLAGFMPPQKNTNLLPIEWQPIPVTSVPAEVDKLLAQNKPCKLYDAILRSLYRNPPADLKKMNEENQDLYKLLTKHTGQNITNMRDITILYDTLLTEKNVGLILPDWTESIFPERMIRFAERHYTFATETPFMKKAKGGPFITEVLNNMIKKQKGVLEPNRKIFLYSGHEHTLANVINALDVGDQTARLCDYGSTLIFELHKNLDSEYDFEIKLFYYINSEMTNPKKVNIPNCESPCTLSKFGEVFKHLLIDDFDEACKNVEHKKCEN